ncbi:MAG: manganese efflux pump MntP family protein [Saccharofermentanales bacterium]|jgi:putative Mn2+ efflux pump MntP
MIYLEVLLIAVSLAMDALAVAVTIGICRAGVRFRHALKVALFFGGFQALMPALGYLAGISVSGIIEPIDHWIAFILLAVVGGRMLYSALWEQPVDSAAEDCPPEDPLANRPLLLLAVATSIDALAAGISLSIGRLPVTATILATGLITAFLSGLGVLLGRRLSFVFQRYALASGGAILVLIGLKILIEHLVV